MAYSQFTEAKVVFKKNSVVKHPKKEVSWIPYLPQNDGPSAIVESDFYEVKG